jgi:hypothetical protein
MIQNKKEIVVEPVMLTEEWPNKLLCSICQERADKQVTTYGAPDGIPRICRYCDLLYRDRGSSIQDLGQIV